MTEAKHEMGRVSGLKPDAVGEPGSRRFRLLVESRNGGSAILWMEKEQLFNLGLALKGIIATMSEEPRERGVERAPDDEESEPSAVARQSVEFQVGRLAVGYDDRTALYFISAHTQEDSEDALAVVSLAATQQEMDALADEAFEVCAAGRPQCPLCGAPMDRDGHICPKHNGHRMMEV